MSEMTIAEVEVKRALEILLTIPLNAARVTADLKRAADTIIMYARGKGVESTPAASADEAHADCRAHLSAASAGQLSLQDAVAKALPLALKLVS
jgi:hypothetical protein